ncbi:hypothetical protein [uncultured Clostridium sp.]|nr:hypothetical protein [uncultured Clostridium sp.]
MLESEVTLVLQFVAATLLKSKYCLIEKLEPETVPLNLFEFNPV